MRTVAAIAYARQTHTSVSYLDVGARGGPIRAWAMAHRSGIADLFLVEPDAEEAIGLRSKWPRATIVEAALGSSASSQTLYVTADPACSSLLEPDLDSAVNVGGDVYAVAATVPVTTTPLSATSVGKVDFAKIDVQGYELEVLKGFGPVLDDVLGLELEVAFQATYKEQPSVGAITEYVLGQGFVPVDIRPLSLERHGIREANMYFVRPNLDERSTHAVTFWRMLLGLPGNSRLQHRL